jgi:thiol-disulfide isomerase/thioredoxin
VALRERLLALGGIVVIVGVVIGSVYAAGLIGAGAGVEGLESVTLLETRRDRGQEGMEVGPRAGQLAPDFEISDFEGERHRLSDYRGQAVYINFWATWCVPCRVEMPDLHILQSEFPDELVVITVNRRESLGRATAFLEELPNVDGGTGISFTVDGVDPDDTLFAEYRALGMPSSVIIDPSGVVARVHYGIIDLEMMRESVRAALGDGE